MHLGSFLFRLDMVKWISVETEFRGEWEGKVKLASYAHDAMQKWNGKSSQIQFRSSRLIKSYWNFSPFSAPQ